MNGWPNVSQLQELSLSGLIAIAVRSLQRALTDRPNVLGIDEIRAILTIGEALLDSQEKLSGNIAIEALESAAGLAGYFQNAHDLSHRDRLLLFAGLEAAMVMFHAINSICLASDEAQRKRQFEYLPKKVSRVVNCAGDSIVPKERALVATRHDLEYLYKHCTRQPDSTSNFADALDISETGPMGALFL